MDVGRRVAVDEHQVGAPPRTDHATVGEAEDRGRRGGGRVQCLGGGEAGLGEQASSSCIEAPNRGEYGAVVSPLASVPARIVAPRPCISRTDASACANSIRGAIRSAPSRRSTGVRPTVAAMPRIMPSVGETIRAPSTTPWTGTCVITSAPAATAVA
ncbi:hypothetical protein J2S44_008056 [Catenuloplanes niger]|uniref:Uncharacterized protein n=1 Tax=Catenuloplanes niger TaxID=587534 RepID=A0AAE4CVV0_9ACTN|nr:hypothetical protein [Catenuloplanes niger]MDR7327806.1 hypothetical protein [Catenuloplanes niger]